MVFPYGLVPGSCQRKRMLVDENGRRIMAEQHPLGDLAPEILSLGYSRRNGKKEIALYELQCDFCFETRFPTITAICEKKRLISTAENSCCSGMHFLMGGAFQLIAEGCDVTGTLCDWRDSMLRFTWNKSAYQAILYWKPRYLEKRAAEHIIKTGFITGNINQG